MPDPETVILKVGGWALTALAVLRVTWHDLNNLMNAVRRKRRQR